MSGRGVTSTAAEAASAVTATAAAYSGQYDTLKRVPATLICGVIKIVRLSCTLLLLLLVLLATVMPALSLTRTLVSASAVAATACVTAVFYVYFMAALVDGFLPTSSCCVVNAVLRVLLLCGTHTLPKEDSCRCLP